MEADATILDLYKLSLEGATKFDYFICGAAGALLAYTAQTSTFTKLETISAVLQASGILILAISFYCGIRRIQYSNAQLRYNHVMLNGEKKAKEIETLLKLNPDETFLCNGVSETRKEVENKLLSYRLASKNGEKLMHKCGNKLAFHGKIQLYFLFVGFFAIVFSRLSLPYEPIFSEHLFSIFR
jgi:hypothetical protein